jgi:pimeloyl-ACP methyl ester carboxylesterase
VNGPVVDVRTVGAGDGMVAFTVGGAGPGVLVPWCNFGWADLPYAAALTRSHTLVTASPRGYGPSSRLDDEGYGADLLVADLLSVTDALGLDRFAVLGYSLSGAVAAWLARGSDRVTAVVAAGFPLLGSYHRLLADVEHKVASGEHDSPGRAALDAEFDSRAALAFYRDLAALSDGALVDDVACPMFSFFGEDDEIINTLGYGVDHLHAGLTQRNVATSVLPGRGHLGALLDPQPALAEITQWLDGANPPTA